MKFRVIPAMLLALGLACSEVCAEFVPGRLYIAGGVDHCVKGEKLVDDGIYEFDPLTGDWSVFATLPESLCGRLGGLTFSPDFSRLRVSSFSRSRILEIDGDGNVEVALGPQDGISGPFGGNNIAYAPNGDFYVGNSTRILRFPAAGGPGQVSADSADGINGYGPLAIAPDGSVYYGPAGTLRREIFRFAPDGQGSVFDTLPENHFLGSLAFDNAGAMYASTFGGTHRYDGQDAASRIQLNGVPCSTGTTALAMSADQETLYQVSANRVRSIDVLTGQTSQIGFIAADFGVGYGMALFVPEPNTLLLLVPFLIAGRNTLRTLK